MNTSSGRCPLFCIYLSAFVCLLPMPSLSAEAPFSESSISSSFGPRIHPTANTWDFHRGIDYAQLKGTPIKAVEGGALDKISNEGNAGWVIGIESKSGNVSRCWSYLHTFQDGNKNLSKPIVVGNFILGKDSDGMYVENAKTGKRMYERISLVAAGDLFAPVGNSGRGTGAHLHLNYKVDGVNYNPLSQLNDIPGNFKVVIKKPADGEEIASNELHKEYPVCFTVDASQGKDLNKIVVSLDGVKQCAGDCSFGYGGRPGERPIAICSAHGCSGVNPVRSTFTNEFVLLSDFSSLREGEHEINITTIDVKGNPCENKFAFSVKNAGWAGTIKGTVIVEKYIDGKDTLVEHPFTMQISLSGEVDINKLKKGALPKEEYLSAFSNLGDKMSALRSSGGQVSPESIREMQNSTIIHGSGFGKCSMSLDMPSENTRIAVQTDYNFNNCERLQILIGDPVLLAKTREDALRGNGNMTATHLLLLTNVFVIEVLDDNTIAVKSSLVEVTEGRLSRNSIKVIPGKITRVAGKR